MYLVFKTFRAYGVGGMKNKTVINAMREFCRISFVYEAKVLPIGAGFGILSWLSCPLVIWTAYAPWAAGTLDTVSYLLICMLPLFCSKLANSIFVDLTSYKNLMISKNKILGVMNEPGGNRQHGAASDGLPMKSPSTMWTSRMYPESRC